MNVAEVHALPSNSPVLCSDGMIGMFIIYPSANKPKCGVQVHGEKDIRWIDVADLTANTKGAIRQINSPFVPQVEFGNLAQRLLALDWIEREGISIPGRVVWR